MSSVLRTTAKSSKTPLWRTRFIWFYMRVWLTDVKMQRLWKYSNDRMNTRLCFMCSSKHLPLQILRLFVTKTGEATKGNYFPNTWFLSGLFCYADVGSHKTSCICKFNWHLHSNISLLYYKLWNPSVGFPGPLHWRLRASGTWRHVICFIRTNLSEEPSYSVFRIK
jgi:hypothetical protein